ncbi:hypothetical protein HMI49_12630 [Corallococcus exercitus]|uniref:Uncharacterized protein n=1 Tax=Corallococcus exercitus TaxID=2316736 RepID=A0A7Y4KJU4_9BACT|nr:hypothetical protein [Corallococcus exercitus]NOK34039.1 hypothetical protein [Corallococcus exercitus]
MGLHDYSAFYRCAYPGGAAFVVIDDARIDEQPRFDLPRLITQVTNIMKFYEFNHRKALIAHLTTQELNHSVQGEDVRFQLADGDEGVAWFNAAGRLTRLTGEALSGRGHDAALLHPLEEVQESLHGEGVAVLPGFTTAVIHPTGRRAPSSSRP